MSKRVLTGLVLALLSISRAQAGFILDMDHATFRFNDSLTYVEVFVSIQRAHLKYDSMHTDSLRADFQLLLSVHQDTAAVISDTFAASDVVTHDQRPMLGQFFPHVFAMVLKPGRYQLRASLFQARPDPEDVITDTITVSAYRADGLSLSDIEVACNMSFSTDISRFSKNGVFVIPNPTGFFGLQLPMFYYYVEGYGLPYDSAVADSHIVSRRVLDAQTGQAAREDVRRWKPTKGESTVIADGFPVATLRTGTYILEIGLETKAAGQKATVRKKFWIYRPDDFAPGRQPALSSEFQSKLLATAPSILEVLDPDSALIWMRYVLSKAEQQRVDRLNADGKREFLRAFWKEREATKPGAANQYFARVSEATRRFSYLSKPGWRTDRGRVFILYGEPDNTARNYATPQMPDHEMWEYNRLEGGVIFVFFDRTGFGDLDLVHSTMRGEIYNPNWHSLSPAARPQNEE